MPDIVQKCCDDMDMEYVGEVYPKGKYFAKDIQCRNCKRTGTDFFNADKGTHSDPVMSVIYDERINPEKT